MGLLDPPALTKLSADGRYGRPLRNVFSRGAIMDQRTNATTSQTSRLRCVIRGGAVMVRLVYANWYLPSGSAEQPMGNDISVKASIENPAISGGRPNGDVVIPVFFGGKRTTTIENNGIAISDPVLVNAPADWAIFVRSCVSVTSGYFPTNYSSSTTGVAQLDTSGVAEGFVNGSDLTDSGQISAATGFVFGPVAILVEDGRDSVLLLGDSHARGTGVVTARGSGLAQAVIDKGLPLVRLAVGGDSFAYSLTASHVYRRMAFARFHRHVIINMGTNDIWGDYSLSTLKANAIAFWKMLSDQGLKVHQSTILPRPGASTDAYLTAANQSIVNPAYESIRTGYNTWLRSGQAAIDAAAAGAVLTSVIDSAALIEVNAANVLTLNGGFWKAPGAGSVSQTGTATSVSTSGSTATITDSTKSWTTNQFVNQVVLITSATAGAGQFGRVSSNTATALTVVAGSAWTAPTGTVTYQVQPSYCWDHVHPTEPGYALISGGLDLSYLKG